MNNPDQFIFKNRYDALINSHADLISRFTPDGILTFVSESYCHYIGKSSETLTGQSLFADVPEKECTELKARFAKLTLIAPTVRGKNSIETPTGDKLTIDWVNTGIFDNSGEVIEIQSIGRDITAQLQFEIELKRSNAEFAQFAHLVAHDLQSPLRNVYMLSIMLKEDHIQQLDEEGIELVDTMNIRLKRMNRLINDLLTFSKVGNKPEKNVIDLNLTLESVLDNLDSDIKESSAIIDFNQLPKVMGQETEYQILLQNIISNAIKFRTEKPPTISIQASLDNNQCHLSIKDNGIGIEMENQRRIFQPLERVHSKNDYEGTGLGLAVCEKICRRLGGKINVTSTFGKGTAVKISLPLASSNQSS